MDDIKQAIERILSEDYISEELEMILEMPEVINPTEFNMHYDKRHDALRNDLLSKTHEVLEETDISVLIKFPMSARGYYVLFTKDKTRIDYLVHYKSKIIPIVGKVVTQVMVWRRAGAAPEGTAGKIFFKYLLPEFNQIMSDDQQSPDGQTFWKNQMNYAVTKGFKVAFVLMKEKEISWYRKEDGLDVVDWIKSKQGWGMDESFQNRRFLISK